MNAIGLNPIKLDAIGLDPIRMNAIRLGVPGASSGSARPYIDPDLLKHVKMAISTWGKSNDDPDRAILKDLSGNGNDMRLLNFGFAENSGYGLPGTDFEGWLCTDGVDDMIESVKPVSEMLEGSNEITVVSIIHQISLRGISDIPLTNYIRESNIGYVRNELRISLNKTGIYGYTCFNIQSPISSNSSVINNILGDKEDYRLGTYGKISNAKLSVQGFIDSSGAIIDTSQVAYAGGFIANKVLTTDEINQIIAYFNLDKYVKPDIYYDVKKQGLTNDTSDEDWYLKDFSGNGRDMTLYNYARTPESGINEEGGLQSDGVDDYGQVTGMPIYKDYTVVADREFLGSKSGSIVSKSHILSNGAFIFETFADKSATTSFGSNTLVDISDFKKISYQSKYIYNGNPIQVGIGVDGDSMCLGVIRENDSRFSKFALWSLLLFPYSLSEFLLERQLKKRKLGTLYPGMVEFRPIVKSNIPYSSISYSVNPGVYVTEGSAVTITITLSNASDKLIGVSSNAISDISISGDNGTYEITGKVTKSPQKINIIISSYLTTLGNETLISNETLIKNE